jgi:hypothetical protein
MEKLSKSLNGPYNTKDKLIIYYMKRVFYRYIINTLIYRFALYIIFAWLCDDDGRLVLTIMSTGDEYINIHYIL